MRKKRISFIVSFELPDDVNASSARNYVRDAVASWRGSLCPPGSSNGDGTFNHGDPMFDMNSDTVHVDYSSIPKRKTHELR